MEIMSEVLVMPGKLKFSGHHSYFSRDFHDSVSSMSLLNAFSTVCARPKHVYLTNHPIKFYIKNRKKMLSTKTQKIQSEIRIISERTPHRQRLKKTRQKLNKTIMFML